MMVNISKKEERMYKIVKPRLLVNPETYNVELMHNAPKEVRETYKQLQKAANYLTHG